MSTPTEIACPNCETKLAGDYCYTCGQRDLGPRLTTRILVQNAFEALTEMDSKLWRTLRELTKNPGRVSLNYIQGERASYINPIKYFLGTFTIYLAIMIWTGLLEVHVIQSVNIDDESMEAGGPIVQFALQSREVLKENTDIVNFLMLPIFAFFLRWQFWRARRNYAETLAFVFFVAGHVQIYATFAALFMFTIGTYNNGVRGTILAIVFLFSARTFFKMGWTKTVLAGLISLVAFSLSGLLVGFSLAALYFFKLL